MFPLTKFTNLFEKNPFITESEEKLFNVKVAYQTCGELNETRDNVVLVCHALTGNAHASGLIGEEEIKNCSGEEYLNKYNLMFNGKAGWWDPLIGEGKVFDTSKYFVICSNIIGSCYGSSGPVSENGQGKKYRMSFPDVTVRDIVNVQKELLDTIGVRKIKIAVGGSLGGMQVLEWGALFPEFVEKLIPIAGSAAHSPWAIALNQVQRNTIMKDPLWNGGNYSEQPYDGLSNARRIAMISYRTYYSYLERFGRKIQEGKSRYQIESYLDYQGDKIVKRFDANTYLYLTRIMDSNDVGRGRGGVKKALSEIKNKTLVIGISTDVLYPADEQREIATAMPNAMYDEIKSPHGHDAFLIEFEQLETILQKFI
ncbi:MAG: homoserine O-acetyltransferase [Melioribacteraceae bacterium]|nr:MAG: homoserine O-acetyltransferase [Melioribacteraceae bacterium]